MWGVFRWTAKFLLLVMLAPAYSPLAMACAARPGAMHCMRHPESVHSRLSRNGLGGDNGDLREADFETAFMSCWPKNTDAIQLSDFG